MFNLKQCIGELIKMVVPKRRAVAAISYRVSEPRGSINQTLATRTVKSFVRLAGLLTLLFISGHGRADDSPQKIASSDLNEFDLAQFCYGARYLDLKSSDRGANPKDRLVASRFGYASLASGLAPEFVYIDEDYRVSVGPHGDRGDCLFRRYLYRLTKDGLFKREEVDEIKFTKIEDALRNYQRTMPHRQGYLFGQAEAVEKDSIGGCLFPIRWFVFQGQHYALLSLGDGIVSFVTPRDEENLDGTTSTCSAWAGKRHLTNSSLASSGGLSFLLLSDNKMFVLDEDYHKGFTFQGGASFQCVRGGDVFSHHILLTKDFFDREVRLQLEQIVQQKNPDRSALLSFADSVWLQKEFAGFISGLIIEKGCR